jgi:hypothetical protein
VLALEAGPGLVAERPILFQGRLVRKILADEKTESRRILFPQPVHDPSFLGGMVWKTKRADTAIQSFNEGAYPEVCPYGAVGSRLWVRESFVIGQKMDGWKPEDGPPAAWYRADENENLLWTDEKGVTSFQVPWKPSIHMPRSVCRLVLEIVSVRVERLQDITEKGAKAEGVEIAPSVYPESGQSYRAAFAFLWNEINLKRGSWSDNPHVWVISFRRI